MIGVIALMVIILSSFSIIIFDWDETGLNAYLRRSIIDAKKKGYRLYHTQVPVITVLRKKTLHRILQSSLFDRAIVHNKNTSGGIEYEMGNPCLQWLAFWFWSHHVYLQPLIINACEEGAARLLFFAYCFESGKDAIFCVSTFYLSPFFLNLNIWKSES